MKNKILEFINNNYEKGSYIYPQVLDTKFGEDVWKDTIEELLINELLVKVYKPECYCQNNHDRYVESLDIENTEYICEYCDEEIDTFSVAFKVVGVTDKDIRKCESIKYNKQEDDLMNNKKFMRFNNIMDAVVCCVVQDCHGCPFQNDYMCHIIYDDMSQDMFEYLETGKVKI